MWWWWGFVIEEDKYKETDEARKSERANKMKTEWLNKAQAMEQETSKPMVADLLARTQATAVEGERRILMSMYNSAKRALEEQISKMRKMAEETGSDIR